MNRSGVTLLQLVVVLGVLAVLFAVGFPRLVSYANAQVVRNDIYDLTTTLNSARYRVRKDNRAVVATFTSTPPKLVVTRGTTVLYSVSPSASSLNITCRADLKVCPTTLAFPIDAPFGTSTYDYKISITRGTRSGEVFVVGPAMNITVK
ncbi:hypothetical protein [Deinococcus pimensis]|uniref:hypothetical protein n=1 Tax=Deinococcus pimensis TaxID=309888 RepID=UPI0004845A0E|nr:hypothetical protein [Deinococcus pimensis]